jgi:hypothetical protein
LLRKFLHGWVRSPRGCRTIQLPPCRRRRVRVGGSDGKKGLSLPWNWTGWTLYHRDPHRHAFCANSLPTQLLAQPRKAAVRNGYHVQLCERRGGYHLHCQSHLLGCDVHPLPHVGRLVVDDARHKGVPLDLCFGVSTPMCQRSRPENRPSSANSEPARPTESHLSFTSLAWTL